MCGRDINVLTVNIQPLIKYLQILKKLFYGKKIGVILRNQLTINYFPSLSGWPDTLYYSKYNIKYINVLFTTKKVNKFKKSSPWLYLFIKCIIPFAARVGTSIEIDEFFVISPSKVVTKSLAFSSGKPMELRIRILNYIENHYFHTCGKGNASFFKHGMNLYNCVVYSFILPHNNKIHNIKN